MPYAGKKTDEKRLVPAKKRGANRKPKTFTTVWAQYSGKTKEGVAKALEELIGRYGEGDMVPMPRKDYTASASWSVVNHTDWNSEAVGLSDLPESSEDSPKDVAYFKTNAKKIAAELAKEEVVLTVKCGGQARMEFFAVPGKDKLQTTRKVISKEAVAEMREIAEMVANMQKDDGDFGTYFHETAVALAVKAGKKGKAKYNEKYDCMLTDDEMEDAAIHFGK